MEPVIRARVQALAAAAGRVRHGVACGASTATGPDHVRSVLTELGAAGR